MPGLEQLCGFYVEIALCCVRSRIMRYYADLILANFWWKCMETTSNASRSDLERLCVYAACIIFVSLAIRLGYATLCSILERSKLEAENGYITFESSF